MIKTKIEIRINVITSDKAGEEEVDLIVAVLSINKNKAGNPTKKQTRVQERTSQLAVMHRQYRTMN